MTHPTTAYPRRRLGVALAFGLALGLAACGSNEDTDADTAAPEPAEQEAVDDAAAAPDEPADEPEDAPDEGGEDTIEVEMVDFAYVGLPDTVPAGTRLSVINTAEEELHELVAFQLPEDEDRGVPALLQLPPEELGPVLGDPTMVLLAAPGGAADRRGR